MSLDSSLDKLLTLLEQKSVKFALAGGLVANMYRNEIRFTNDIDVAVLLDTKNIKIIEEILSAFSLNLGQAREGDLKNVPFRRKRERSDTQIIVGRNSKDKSAIGIDFLLITIPWVEEAVLRANYNIIEYSNFKIPALTLEDMIISKLYALNNTTRFKDLDDLEQFLTFNTNIDYVYLIGRMIRYQLAIPKDIRKKIKIHSELGKASREIEKQKKV